MKSKLILLPIALTTLTPVVSMVGCDDPKPTPPEPEIEYEPVFIDQSLSTPTFDIFRDHYYKFACDSFPVDVTTARFYLAPKDIYPAEIINVELIKVEVNGVETYDYQEILDGYWKVKFYPLYEKSFAIYIKSNEEKLDWVGKIY